MKTIWFRWQVLQWGRHPQTRRHAIHSSVIWTAPGGSRRPGGGMVDPDRLGDGETQIWRRTLDPFDHSPVINPAPTH
jgi:hypothetical protein